MELVDNNGPNTLERALHKLLRSATDVRLQVAFASRAGVQSIVSGLQRVADAGHVRVITGLYQYVTEPSALRMLLHAARGSRGRLEVHVSKDAKLHTKLYMLAGRHRVTCIIGSSNLSADGLSSTGELCLLFAERSNSRVVVNLSRRFEDAWAYDSIPLTAAIIDKYESCRPVRAVTPMSHGSLRQILGPRRRRPKNLAAAGNIPASLWRDVVESQAGAETCAVITRETNWDRLGLDWHSGPVGACRRGDYLLVFDFSHTTPSVRLAEVRALVRTSIPTPDGRHFVAYRTLRGQRERRVGANLWEALIALGVIASKRKARRPSRLSMKRFEELRRVLRTR